MYEELTPNGIEVMIEKVTWQYKHGVITFGEWMELLFELSSQGLEIGRDLN